MGDGVKTFEVESLFLWAFVLVLVRRMTAVAAIVATAAATGCAMYWEGFTLAMCLVLKFGCTE